MTTFFNAAPLQTEYTLSAFLRRPDVLAGRVIHGEDLTLTYVDREWAYLSSLVESSLPEDGHYSFVGMEWFRNGKNTPLIKEHFAVGRPVIIKDYPRDNQHLALTGKPNKNIILMCPLGLRK